MLLQKLDQFIEEKDAKLSVVLKNLTADKWLYKLNEEKRIRSASTIKILIMIEAFYSIIKGNHSLDEKITVNSNDKVDYSIITDLDTDLYTFKDIIMLMIIVSDNTATNILIDLLGFDNINKRAKKLGLKNTILKRKMMDFEAAKEGKKNMTSAQDMAVMLHNIYNKEILNDNMCEIIIDIMKRQKDKGSLTRYIPEDTTIAHKCGDLKNLNHDVGIFYLDDMDYLLGVFVEEAESNLEAKRIIGRISEMVYRSFKV